MPPMIIGDPPLFDLIERSKAAETGKIIVEAAISNAWGWNAAVDFTHLFREHDGSGLDHIEQRGSRKSITRAVIPPNSGLGQEFGICSAVSSVATACCGLQSLSIDDRD